MQRRRVYNSERIGQKAAATGHKPQLGQRNGIGNGPGHSIGGQAHGGAHYAPLRIAHEAVFEAGHGGGAVPLPMEHGAGAGHQVVKAGRAQPRQGRRADFIGQAESLRTLRHGVTAHVQLVGTRRGQAQRDLLGVVEMVGATTGGAGQ